MEGTLELLQKRSLETMFELNLTHQTSPGVCVCTDIYFVHFLFT